MTDGNAPVARGYPDSTSALLTKAGDAFEFIRLKLINCLNEPQRSAFWKAVEMRDLLRAKTLARQTTASVLPHGEGQAVECDGGLRTFDTQQTVLRRSGNVFTITCDDGEVANRVADQLRTFAPAQTAPVQASQFWEALKRQCAASPDKSKVKALVQVRCEDVVAAWNALAVSSTVLSPAALDQYEFPYQQTFEAIAAATEIYPSKEQALGLSISVKKFQEAFNNHRDRRPIKGVVVSSTDKSGAA